MSGKCGKCYLDFSGNEFFIKCVECLATFHPPCTSDGSAQNLTKSKMKTWKCDSCRDETVSNKKSEDISSDETSTILDAIAALKIEINSNTDSKIGEVKISMELLTDELAKINNRFTALEESHSDLCKRCDTLERDRDDMGEELQGLRQQLIDAEQHSRCANLEITGLPLTTGEDVYVILGKVAQVINVPYKKEDISMAHRLRLFSKKHAHPPIIAQFVSRGVREAWLSAARRKKGISTTEVAASLAPGNVYINEHLTPHNKALLGRARRLVRERKIYFAGYFNGKVLIKVKENSDSSRVWQLQNLDTYDR